MDKGSRTANPVVLRAGMSIGSVSAETDDGFLVSCFVQHPAVSQAIDLTTAGMVLAGRTGSGKTAILKHIAGKENSVAVIEPAEMSMSYIVNSDIVTFLKNAGADLNLFFQLLWKHVLCLELIRLKYHILDAGTSRTLFDALRDRFFPDQRKRSAIDYLRSWEDKFWITMDVTIREIAEKYERAFLAEFGIEFASRIKAGGTFGTTMTVEEKAEIVARVRKIVDARQLAELARVIDLLSTDDLKEDKMVRHYILLDSLDDNWVDDSFRFKLVRALIETVKKFRPVKHLKILVSLRSDILERVMLETKYPGFQREKNDELFIRLRWSAKLLGELVERRLNELFRRQYTGRPIGFQDLFVNRVGQVPTFEYMLERTLMRPRDIITFVNECLKEADGRTEITAAIVRKAEAEFSRIRRQALEEEWGQRVSDIAFDLRFLSQ